jgi:ABC-2 type transport system ATP-binding protein
MSMTQPDRVTGGIRARGISRSFGPVHAVQGIDLDAPPGQVTALVGPNGAGKTTALLVLATLLTPDAGEVRVAGFDPVTQPDEVRARMGWSPDVFGLYDTLTCREYLEVMAAAYRLPKERRGPRADELLTLARLPYPDAPVHTLSRGQKQRLGLVRALVHDPEVLLLDEPASGLDPRSRVELRDLLRRLAGEGRAVLVSSHILSDLEEVADRVVFVDGGRTVGQHAIGDLPEAGSARTYRMRGLDPVALQTELERRGVGWSGAGHAGIDVQVLGGEESAARLLGELVAAGLRITAFAPLGGSLEATYLDLVEGQR